jgi:hypothetical protein
MDSHSLPVTVEVAPADSAVSVVGTGVELAARAFAMMSEMCCSLMSCVTLFGCAE